MIKVPLKKEDGGAAQVRDLAEYLAGVIGPHDVRGPDHNQTPYAKGGTRLGVVYGPGPYDPHDPPMAYQLDRENDWFLNATKKLDGDVEATVSHRYNGAGQVAAVQKMLAQFTNYTVLGNKEENYDWKAMIAGPDRVLLTYVSSDGGRQERICNCDGKLVLQVAGINNYGEASWRDSSLNDAPTGCRVLLGKEQPAPSKDASSRVAEAGPYSVYFRSFSEEQWDPEYTAVIVTQEDEEYGTLRFPVDYLDEPTGAEHIVQAYLHYKLALESRRAGAKVL